VYVQPMKTAQIMMTSSVQYGCT